MINNTIPLGISPKAWRGEASRQKLLCQMEERFPGNSFYRLLLDCPAFEITMLCTYGQENGLLRRHPGNGTGERVSA